MNITLISMSCGGVMHYAVDLANYLSRTQGTRVSFLGYECCEKFLDDAITYKKISRNNLVNSVTQYLLELDSSIVHFTGFHPTILITAQKIKKHSIPVVLTLHDLNPHLARFNLLTKVKRKLIFNRMTIKRAVKISDEVIFLSSYVAGQAYERFRRIFPVIRLCQDSEKFRKISSISTNNDFLSSLRLKLLFFGSINLYKGLQYLIRALEILKRKNAPVELYIYGKFTNINFEIPPKIRNIVHIRNEMIPDEEVANIFSKCDVVVMPYVEASQSGVLPLAFEFGKPVIASSIGCFTEWIIPEVNGLLFSPRNSVELAEQIEKCLDRRFLELITKNVTQTAKAHNWSRYIKEYIKIYEKII